MLFLCAKTFEERILSVRLKKTLICWSTIIFIGGMKVLRLFELLLRGGGGLNTGSSSDQFKEKKPVSFQNSQVKCTIFAKTFHLAALFAGAKDVLLCLLQTRRGVLFKSGNMRGEEFVLCGVGGAAIGWVCTPTSMAPTTYAKSKTKCCAVAKLRLRLKYCTLKKKENLYGDIHFCLFRESGNSRAENVVCWVGCTGRRFVRSTFNANEDGTYYPRKYI